MADRPRAQPFENAPLEQVVAGAVTVLTLTVAFGLMFAGVSFFWVAFPVGFGGVLPLAIGATRLYQERQASEDAAAEDPIATLRERYAAGELTDAEFERQVEKLLETESVEAPAGWDGDSQTERTWERESE